jgi:quercetin dioxygenase-like cupin family protein
VFELADELRDLRRDIEFTSGDRAAKTLAKTDELRVTLVLLKGGATLHPESAAGGATLQVVEGRIRVQTEGENWSVGRMRDRAWRQFSRTGYCRGRGEREMPTVV